MLIFHKNTGRNFLQGTIPAFNASEIINDDDASDDEWPPTASHTASPSVTPTQAPTSLDDDASDDEWPPTASPTASPSVTPTQAPTSLDDDASDDEWPPTATPTASPSVTPTQAPISLPTVDSPGCRFERLKGMLFSISNKLAVKNEPTYRLVSLSLCK